MTEMLEKIKVLLVLSLSPVLAQVRPPNLSPDNLPDTAFTCEDKVTGGYYADVEADCQLFHVCVQVSEYEFQDFHFLCPNDTVFDQQHLVCTNWFEVDCHAQLAFFSNDFGIKKGGGVGEDDDTREEQKNRDQEKSFLGFSGQSGLIRNRNTGRGQLEVGRRRPSQSSHRSHQQRRFPVRGSQDYDQEEEDYDQEEEVETHNSGIITGSTPIPLGFTTTIRPSRSAPESGGLLSGRNLRTFSSPPAEEFEKPTERPFIQPFTSFGRDGRRPKVKSNIRAKLANGFSGKKKFFKKHGKPRKKAGRKVQLDHRHRKKIEFVQPQEEDLDEQDQFSGPEVRPDGRAPRVKADLFAEKRNHDQRQETSTFEPFIEQFFASPSSPKPFIFQGSPSPRPRGADTLITSSTEEAFFIPTIKPGASTNPSQDFFSSSQDPEDETDISPQSESDRFLSRSNPGTRLDNSRPRIRGRNHVVIQSTAPSFSDHPESIEAQATHETPVPTSFDVAQPRVKSNQRQRKKFGKSSKHKFSFNTVSGDKDCNNPFLCPPKSVAKGRRPRVKSNLRAKKRNFWQKQSGGGAKISGNLRRKIRRGRKQVPRPVAEVYNEVEDNDKRFEELQATITTPEEEDSWTTIEQFIPTIRSIYTTTPRPTTYEREVFEDFFDSQNDLFVASSTVSPVIFRGSPTPGGWASSPAPNFDGSGSQVSFSSPSPFGFGPSGRPSFNNIGAHVDLGPKKPQTILEPEQLFFISSTMSNKIFIGEEEENTTPYTPVEAKEEELNISSRFSSFPIRGLNTLGGSPGGLAGLPFRPRKSPFKFGRQREAEEEKEEKEEPESVTEAQHKEEEEVTVRQTAGRRSPRVKSNLLFNRRKQPHHQGRPGRGKFAPKIQSVPVSEESLETHTSPPEVEEEEEEEAAPDTSLETETPRKKSQRFHGRRPFSLRTPSVSITNRLLANRKFRGRKFGKELKQQEVEIPVTTLAPIHTSTVFTAFAESEPSKELSVETELLEDEENINNEIEADRQEVEKQQETKEKSRPILPGRKEGRKPKPRKWPSIKKAKAPPLNGHIRVEFKKASAVEEVEEGEKKKKKTFFVKPDGRKPRVKANLRARIANRGKFPFGQQGDKSTGFRHSTKVTNQEAFDEASSQLALAPPYSGDEENEEEEDNTEKREINIDDAPVFHNQIVHQPEDKKPTEDSFLHLPNLQPVILNRRQERNPALPPDVLARIRHITDIHSLPPLPGGARPLGGLLRSPRVKSDLRKQKRPVIQERVDIVEEEVLEASQSPVTLLDQIVGTSVVSSTSSESSSVPVELSAFRALLQQTEKSESEI